MRIPGDVRDSNPYSDVELNFSLGFNIIAPYMEMLHINRSPHGVVYTRDL